MSGLFGLRLVKRWATGLVALMAIGGMIAAIQTVPAKAETIEYGKGTFEISAPIVLPDGYTLLGAGVGETIIKAAPGYTGTLVQTSGSMDPASDARHPGVKLRHLTLDGNGTAERGAYLLGVDGLVVDNIEVKNTAGTALEHQGLGFGGTGTNNQTWHNVTARDCGGWGVVNGRFTRKVSYANVQVFGCDNGMAIEHPEAQVSSIQLNDNRGEGLVLKNTYSSNFANIRSTGNGSTGIHVTGMAFSFGSDWQALNNANKNVWFDGAAAPNTGVTRQTTITGLQAGKIPYHLGDYDGRPSQPLVIDNGVTVRISNKQILTN